MKKLFYVLVLLVTFGVVNQGLAQWTTQNSGVNDLLAGVFFTDANTGYAVGYDTTYFNGVVLKTTNGGNDWIQLSVSSTFNSVYFTDANTGYIAAYDTVLKTTDAGANWSKYPFNMGVVVLAIHFYNSTIGYAAGVDFPDTNRTLLRTTNAGDTWLAQTIPSGHYRPNSFFCTSEDTCYFVGGYALKTTDGGTTWNTMNTPSNADWSSVYFTSATNGVIVGGNSGAGYIDRTINAGTSWTTVHSGTEFLTSVYFADANTGYAVGTGGIILNTTDSGATWAPQTSPTNLGLNWVHFPVANIGYAVGDGGSIVKYSAPTGISNELTSQPTSFGLSQNYPNPFNPSTLIKYQIANDGFVNLKVFNSLGKEVVTLINNFAQAGSYEVSFDASDLPSGLYVYTLRAGFADGGYTQTKKMILLK